MQADSFSSREHERCDTKSQHIFYLQQGDYVFGTFFVAFLCVCLSIFQQYYSKSCEWIVKFYGRVRDGNKNK